ncbi:PaaI family thioesterase [uncultured Jatrophihabitans sp.]|uniref:PaaI family thioesterase n=1 Tax=uncultured Jatrophihabitans sp. TaxID=1610747 RepID=UPI0035CB9877
MATRTEARSSDRERIDDALAQPLTGALGCFLLDPDDVAAGVAFVPGQLAGSRTGGVHPAALAAVLELAGYLVVLPTLDEDEHAVTHASALQVLGGAGRGDRVEARAQLDRRSRRLAFVSAAATVDGLVVATAQLTMSVGRRKH